VISKQLFLRKCFLFSCLALSDLSKISAIAHLKTFTRHETIFQEGDQAQGVFIVGRGKVEIYKLSRAGGEQILHLIEEGGVFAEAAIFGRLKTYPAFARTIQESILLFIPKKDFLDLMKTNFSLTLAVMASMTEKLKYFNALVEELSFKTADARLAQYLLDLALKKGSDVFLLDIKKIELAKKLGIVPETLSRIFKRFIRGRLLCLQKDKITLYAKENLRVISSGEKPSWDA